MNILRSIIILAAGGLFLLYMRVSMIMLGVTNETSVENTKEYRWNRVDTGPETVSADGSRFFMYSNKGSENDLIIYFSGGGSAWNAETAFQPMGLKTLLKNGDNLGYYFDSISPHSLFSAKGIMDRKDKSNPFRCWNIAYIPYSTGDFHVGNNTFEFELEGEKKLVRFNGRNNVLACLDWIYSNFEKPDRILICGESAGAFGSLFWLPEIAGRYGESELFYLCDAAYLKCDNFPAIFDEIWKADSVSYFGFTPGIDPVSSAFTHISGVLPKVTMMHSNTVADAILSTYSAMINNRAPGSGDAVVEWSRDMKVAVAEMSASLDNYFYYLTDYRMDPEKGTTTHTISRSKLFSQAEENGTVYSKWVSDIVLHGKRYSVGTEFLTEAE